MRKNFFLIVSLITILIGLLLSRCSEELSNKMRYPQRVKEILSQKCEQTHILFDRLEGSAEKDIPNIIAKADEEGIILLLYRSDSLVFWSSNNVPVYKVYPKEILEPRIVKFFNSFFYVVKKKTGADSYIGLISIKNRYPYENDFLQSGFNPVFRLPKGSVLEFTPGKGYDVTDTDGAFLFSIIIPPGTDTSNPRITIGLIICFAGFVLLAIFLFRYIGRRKTALSKFLTGFAVISIFISLRILLFVSGFKPSGLSLFNPFLFADSAFVPSLGDLFLNTLLIFYLVLIVFRYASLSKFINGVSRIRKFFVYIVLTIVFLALYFCAHYVGRSLIFNSNISFQPNEIDQLSLYTFISVLIIGMNYFSAVLFLIWGLKILNDKKDFHGFLITMIVLSIDATVSLILSGYTPDVISIIFLYVVIGYFFFLHYRRADIFRYSVWVLFLLGFTCYLVTFLIQQSGIREERVRSLLALGLADEHDPIAEYLLTDISDKLDKEQMIKTLVRGDSIDIDKVTGYLRKNHFKGYWNKYNIVVAVCGPVDSLLFEEPEFQWFHCYNYYGQIIRDVGLQLPGSRFYYLNDFTGRISYLGVFPFPLADYPYERTVYIELDSRLSNEFIGYPELLLDRRLQDNPVLDRYSYAKYHKNELIAQRGDFNYALRPDLFGKSDTKFRTMKFEGYSHLIYSPGNQNLIVLSLPAIGFIDLLIGFSYIFLLFYLCLLLVFAVKSLNRKDFRFLSDLRSKIQFSIISILLASMILIAAGTIWLNIRNYRLNQDKILHEKLQSIQVELTRRLGLLTELSNSWSTRRYDNLNQLLIRYSDAFFTDINLYYPSGELLSTSRYEIFQAGLQGEKMDPVALYMLNNEKRALFIHREKIGSLTYRSAYIPFKNSEGKLLAYLNIPYFTKQAELQAALSTLIVTIVNIYVILILITIVITILISNQITKPLNMLQDKLRQLKLGNRYEQIHYKRNDEIGRLVAEYNRMVVKLEESVEMLARSERESAWREMAKQIAHEIKNPLTPMRLSVQQLQKLWNEKREDFDTYIKNVTVTLIEQIDNLSAIASEFSNFAKMPAVKIEPVDLVDIVGKTVELFGGNEAYTIQFKKPKESIIINADKEQLSRVFINLLKNAAQSIPDARKGKIGIDITKLEKEVTVSVSDNGTGISDEVKPKLFTPNFTTKSGGTGLGLAIVKNILDQLGGEISYTTKHGSGSKFQVTFPLAAG